MRCVFSPMMHSCSTMAAVFTMQWSSTDAKECTSALGAMNTPVPSVAEGATNDSAWMMVAAWSYDSVWAILRRSPTSPTVMMYRSVSSILRALSGPRCVTFSRCPSTASGLSS